MSSFENTELNRAPVDNQPEAVLIKAAFDVPGSDPRERMIKPLENGQALDPKDPNYDKPSKDRTYSVEFRSDWLDEGNIPPEFRNQPTAMERLNKIDPNKVSDFFSRGLGIRPQDQVRFSGLTDAQLMQVTNKFSNLKNLNIGLTELSNTGLKEVTDKFKKLEDLHIDGTRITNEGLASLQGLPNLKKLDIANNQINDKGLAALKGLNNLEELNIGYSPDISDKGLASLKEFKNLKTLILNDSNVSDSSLQQIAQMTKIEHLALSGTAVTDKGLKQIQNMPNLKNLVLTDTSISNNSIATLEKMQTLKSLTLVGTNFTEAGVAKLQKSLPDCQINWLAPIKPKGRLDMAKDNLPSISIG